MNWVDILVILVALLAGLSGARQGVVIALPAFAGVALGAVAGIQLAPAVVDMFDATAPRVAFAVGTVVLAVALGETLGVWLGHKVKARIQSPKLSSVDNALGAVAQGAVVFVVAWLIALPLTGVAGLPGLTRAINGSVVLGGVNGFMPQAAKQLPDELEQLLDQSGLPSVVEPFEQAPIRSIEPPDPELRTEQTAQRLESSVLKIRGNAPGCSRALEGSGFVVAPQRVMTNAHVVAGTERVRVETDKGTLGAEVVYFDEDADVAILRVPGLAADRIPLAPGAAYTGDDGIVLGYPLDGPYTATAARIRERIKLTGPDIYDESQVTRQVYTLRGTVRSGNSGGPLVSPKGRVIGLVFGAAVDNPKTGFALTAAEIRDEVRNAAGYVQPVDTGHCTK